VRKKKEETCDEIYNVLTILMKQLESAKNEFL